MALKSCVSCASKKMGITVNEDFGNLYFLSTQNLTKQEVCLYKAGFLG